MDNQQQGANLNQLSRLMFDSAARKWYGAIGIEVTASALAIFLSVLQLPDVFAICGAIVSVGLLIWAYVYRLQFDDLYDLAEEIRRQSVLTEAFGWLPSAIQISQWRQAAGESIRHKLKNEPRAKDYYATEQEIGVRRLAEMTAESAFYTRHLYHFLRKWIWICFITICIVVVFALVIAAVQAVPANMAVLISKIVLAVIPIVLGVNLLGWAIKLGRLSDAICKIEDSLEGLKKESHYELGPVLRLVFEYNCQVVQGLPILNTLFQHWRGEIADLWSQHVGSQK